MKLKRIATAVFSAGLFVCEICSCKDSPSKNICFLKESSSIHVVESEFYSIAWDTPTCIEN